MKKTTNKKLTYKGAELLTFSPESKRLRKFYKAHPRKLKGWLAKNLPGVDMADFLNLPDHNNHRTAILKLKVNQ